MPFFAVVAGPVLAWNLQDVFARRPPPPPRRPWARLTIRAATALLAVAFLACLWPGWLQGPPFEPRRWAGDPPPALARGAEVFRQWHAAGAWPPGTRTLHLSPDTANAFRWLCPEDDQLLDAQLAADVVAAAGGGEPVDDRLRQARVSRIVVYGMDRGLSVAVLERLLAAPDRWPLLHLGGGVVVFGWRDPARPGAEDPFRDREVDLDRLAFHPTTNEMAPPSGPARGGRRWWDAFWKPAPSRSPDRDEATVLLLKADAMRQLAPARHLNAWEAGQVAALVGAGGRVGPFAPTDHALRLALLRPPLPDRSSPGEAPPPVTQTIFSLQRQFVFLRGDTPPGVLFAAVRAARRAAAADPTDAGAHLVLGQAYLRLLGSTTERAWAGRLPQLARLRQAQASTALNRALALDPGLAQAHLELGRLYQNLGCLDLAAAHLRAYRTAAARPGQNDTPVDTELARLEEEVERLVHKFSEESARSSVADRAARAANLGLGGKARDILLESDVAAFGTQGTELELDLLLRTGRADDVLDWTTPELKGSLGVPFYHWSRAQALAAIGNYAAADAELVELIGPAGQRLDVDQVAGVFGLLVGRAVLDEQTGGPFLPHLIRQALGRKSFQSGIGETLAELAQLSDGATIRGLVALEAGEIARTREAFHTALALSPDRSADTRFGFRAWPIARGYLRWIDAASPDRPETFMMTVP
ncbi:MAG: hypothetical protein JWO38_5041 [Gemmataceae bacterium]|nr:hypothetical protein [Gemmataceae bacterium]